MAIPIGRQIFLLKVSGLLIVLVVLSYLNIVSRNVWSNNNFRGVDDVLDPKIEEKTTGLPTRLIIPKINVDAKIVAVGVNVQGEMEAPNNASDVGWFEMGPRPAEMGSAVIDGHFDDNDGGDGVFFDLYKLRPGDRVEVENTEGAIFTFVVKESRVYEPGYADEVFNQGEGVHLNLITCDGVWDGIKKSFTKRLVVYTDLVE